MNSNDPVTQVRKAIAHDDWSKENEGRLRSGFQEMNAVAIGELTDKQLAVLQSEVPRDAPQFIRAEHEWQRRLQARQLRLMRFAIVASLVSALMGAAVGALIARWK